MSVRPLRVVAIIDTEIVSGPGRQLAALVPALQPLGVDLRIALFQRRGSPTSAYQEHLQRAGISYSLIPYASRFDRSMLAELRRTLAEIDPHVVQTHSYRPTALAYLLRRGGASWRWAGFFHGTTNEDLKVRVYHWLDRTLLPRSDRIVVMSRTQLGHFESRADGRVRQIYNAVLPTRSAEPDRATQDVFDRVAALPKPRIGVIGRLSQEKGVDVMLRAQGLLHARGTRCSLIFAGDGPERDRLTALRDELDLAADAHFVGPLLPIEPLYPLVDLLVIPSRSEGLPNVLLEAFRAERAVVTTRVGAVPEVIGESSAGVIVPPENPEALADGIERALQTAYEPAAVESRREIVRRFSLTARAEAHRALYDEMLS